MPPAPHSHSLTIAVAIVGLVVLLAILWMTPRALDALLLLIERRRPLVPAERARLALAAHYAALIGMHDNDLAGLPPRRRQTIWSLLARQWNIRGTRTRKRVLAQETLTWLRDEGDRGNPKLAPPPGADAAAHQRALLAWDLSRLVFVSRLCCFAGYLDEADAWQFIHAAARPLAGSFDSWAAYAQALLAGRALWAGGQDPAVVGAVEKLLADGASAWQRYPWASAVAP